MPVRALVRVLLRVQYALHAMPATSRLVQIEDSENRAARDLETIGDLGDGDRVSMKTADLGVTRQVEQRPSAPGHVVAAPRQWAAQARGGDGAPAIPVLEVLRQRVSACESC